MHITETQVCQLAKGTAPTAQNQAKQKEINYETPLYKCNLRIQTVSLSGKKDKVLWRIILEASLSAHSLSGSASFRLLCTVAKREDMNRWLFALITASAASQINWLQPS